MRILGWLLFGILALAVILLSVANRQPVLISLDPLNASDPRLGLEMPLALVVLVSLFVGILIGGFVSWIGGMRKRRQLARRLETKAAQADATKMPATGTGRGLVKSSS